MSYDLATIRTDAPIDFTPEANLRKEPNAPALYDLFLKLEFNKLIDKLGLKAPQGEVRQEEQFTGSCTSEDVTDRVRAEELLALWRTKDSVDVLALPSLDVVVVEHCESESDSHAAILRADQLEGYNEVLKALMAPDIKKNTHDVKTLLSALLNEGIEGGGFVFDTALAAYLLSPTDGSYELETLGMRWFNHEFDKAKDTYLSPDAFTPLADQGAVLGAFLSHCALIGALKEAMAPRLEELGMHQLYYDIELLNPTMIGSTFEYSEDQDMIMGIGLPDDDIKHRSELLCSGSFNASYLSNRLTVRLTSIGLYNFNIYPFNGNVYLKLTGDNGDYTLTTASFADEPISMFVRTSSGASFYGGRFSSDYSSTLPDGLPDGTYQLYLAVQDGGYTEVSPMSYAEGSVSFYTLTKSGSNVTLEPGYGYISSGIDGVTVSPDVTGKPADNRIYSIDGRYVGTDETQLPKGLYIRGGKKFVKK